MNKKTIRDVNVIGKKVLMRVDFNVPIKNGSVNDDTRLVAALPTIEHVLDQGGSLVLMSHLGRPKGTIKEEFSLRPVAKALSGLLGQEVKFISNFAEAKEQASSLKAGEVMLLENLRFNPEEEGKGVDAEAQEVFAKELAALGDIYVNDAFGTAHRAHASMAVVTKYMGECVAGFLLEKEINYLGKTLENPERPFIALIGGAKISGKIDVITHLLDKVDALLIGGGMAYTFFLAQGRKIGNSISEVDKVALAENILALAKEKQVKLLLPVDNVIADSFSETANTRIIGNGDIEEGWEGLDIGPKTSALFTEEINRAKTIVWNGPMGCFEMAPFATGTNAVAEAIARSDAVSIVGGGDSVSAIKKAGLADRITHISTGGGASLEFLEGKNLPGVVALSDK